MRAQAEAQAEAPRPSTVATAMVAAVVLVAASEQPRQRRTTARQAPSPNRVAGQAPQSAPCRRAVMGMALLESQSPHQQPYQQPPQQQQQSSSSSSSDDSLVDFRYAYPADAQLHGALCVSQQVTRLLVRANGFPHADASVSPSLKPACSAMEPDATSSRTRGCSPLSSDTILSPQKQSRLGFCIVSESRACCSRRSCTNERARAGDERLTVWLPASI